MSMQLTTTERLAIVARIVKVAPTSNAVGMVADMLGWQTGAKVCQFDERTHGKTAANLTAMSLVSVVERQRQVSNLIAILESLEKAQ
jgi:hypothetical protein